MFILSVVDSHYIVYRGSLLTKVVSAIHFSFKSTSVPKKLHNVFHSAELEEIYEPLTFRFELRKIFKITFYNQITWHLDTYWQLFVQLF